MAVGWPIGIILDNEKGDTQGAATAGKLKLENIWFANMDICGSDYNKIYKDELYDYATKTTDASKSSFSSTFFKAQSGNKYIANASGLFDNTTSYMPASGSPLLTAAVFTNSLLSSWFDKVSYIGAFAQGDEWLKGWSNFDPQKTQY